MKEIRLADQIVAAVMAHADNCSPEECCGLLASDQHGQVRFVYPLTNVEASAQGFTIAPEEAYGAFLHADRMGWKVAGVFHSHPGGPDRLSARDVDEAADPSWLHFLVSPAGIKAYRVDDGVPVQIDLQLVS